LPGFGYAFALMARPTMMKPMFLIAAIACAQPA
jgi:hypothetical protein